MGLGVCIERPSRVGYSGDITPDGLRIAERNRETYGYITPLPSKEKRSTLKPPVAKPQKEGMHALHAVHEDRPERC